MDGAVRAYWSMFLRSCCNVQEWDGNDGGSSGNDGGSSGNDGGSS